MNTPTYFDARRLLELFEPETETAVIAEAIGLSASAVKQWRCNRRFRLDAYKADRYALAIGVHPAEVWGSLWWESALLVA